MFEICWQNSSALWCLQLLKWDNCLQKMHVFLFQRKLKQHYHVTTLQLTHSSVFVGLSPCQNKPQVPHVVVVRGTRLWWLQARGEEGLLFSQSWTEAPFFLLLPHKIVPDWQCKPWIYGPKCFKAEFRSALGIQCNGVLPLSCEKTSSHVIMLNPLDPT